MNKQNPYQRNKDIIKLRQDRYKYREIAKMYNLSHERIRQIIVTNGKVRSINPLMEYLQDVGQFSSRGRTREMVRLRDNHTCQDCGVIKTTKSVLLHNKKIKQLKGKIKALDVHHINGLCGKKSKGYDSFKDLSGMVTLCHKCHYNRPEHRVKK